MLCDLIIPAYNERPNIDALFDALDDIRSSQPNLLRHIVLADNDSTDGTADAARKRGAVVVTESQRGYGAACLAAMDWIGRQDVLPEVVLYLDADLSDDPAQMPRLLKRIESGEAEFVIGNRRAQAEPGALNLVQRFGNGLACALMRLFTGRTYRDLGPFRALTWDALQRLDMRDRTWGWTVEMQMKAAIVDLPTVEIDVPYRKRQSGKSKISGTVRGVVAAGIKIITTIFVVWLRRNEIRRAGLRNRSASTAGYPS